MSITDLIVQRFKRECPLSEDEAELLKQTLDDLLRVASKIDPEDTGSLDRLIDDAEHKDPALLAAAMRLRQIIRLNEPIGNWL
jgi:hypothetical protein